MEPKQITRKLRRRANEPAPTANEKRRKSSPTQLNCLLTEEEIMEDLHVSIVFAILIGYYEVI